jgi:hypothetical protein
MKGFLINCVNWSFESHAISMPGWAWIVAPIIGTIALWFIIALVVGGIIEHVFGGFWNR